MARMSTSTRFAVWGPLLGLLALVSGACGPDGSGLVPVEGVLRYNDQPLAGAEIVFHPVSEGPGWMPVAVTGPDGSFRPATREPGDGIPPGRYRLTVVWRPDDGTADEPPNLLPPRYARPDTSGLDVEVGPETGRLPDLQLAGPPRPERRP
jgi:hypothetical protein